MYDKNKNLAYSVGLGLEASIRGIRSWAKSDLRRFDAQYNVAYTCNLNIILFNRYLFSNTHTHVRARVLTYARTYKSDTGLDGTQNLVRYVSDLL